MLNNPQIVDNSINIGKYIWNFVKTQYINKVLKEHTELSLELAGYMILHPEYESVTKLVYCICNNIILPKCKICNKQVNIQ